MNSQNNRCLAQGPASLPARLPAGAIRPGFRRWLVGATDRALGWFERSQSRRQLAKLDDRQLHDIGVARADAEREARKPFWRA